MVEGGLVGLLLIEDDLEVARFVMQGLVAAGYTVDLAKNGTEGLEKALNNEYDLYIVDRMLSGMQGIDIIKNIRLQGISTPVIILSAMADVQERVEGLQAGSDDYLVKPFAFEELLARVEALLRRDGVVTTHLRVADLEMDLLTHKVKRAGEKINLQPREYRLLEYLMQNAGQVVTRAMLLENVWEYHFDPQTNVIDVHISRLRQKIDKGFERQLLSTVRGAGYMLHDE